MIPIIIIVIFVLALAFLLSNPTTWFKNSNKPSPVKKETNPEKLAVMKQQYKAIFDIADKMADKENNDNQKYLEKKNGVCPKCGSEKVNDRITRMQGSINGSMSGESFSFLTLGYGKMSGSMSGKFDTNEVNKCNNCQHEWKKETMMRTWKQNIIENKFYHFSWYFSAMDKANNTKFDPTDLSEKYSSKEEKSASHLKDAGSWKESVYNFWKDTSIEVIKEIANEVLDNMYKYDFGKYYNVKRFKDELGLRSIDDFMNEQKQN